MKTYRKIIIYSVTLFLGLAGMTGRAAATPDLAMCRISIFGSDNSLFRDRFPVADDAFDKGKYTLAFQAYYQYFFCFMGNSETINPAAEDSGAASLLQQAISEAVHGNYALALAQATAAIDKDPNFGEAQFIQGNVAWIQKKHHAARVFWRAAADNSGYPLPPHDVARVEPLTVAARRMLQVHI